MAESDVEADDLKLARLIETFEDIEIEFVESVIAENPSSSLEFLINECKKHKNMISSMDGISIECKTSHIPTLDTIDSSFHYLFDPYLCDPNLFELIQLFIHLSIMREQCVFNDNLSIFEFNICIKTVFKFMKNIHCHPKMAKYRRIKQSNKIFQQKVAKIDGYKYLLSLCGWIYVSNDSDGGIFLFESQKTENFIKLIVDFLNEYMKHSKIRILPTSNVQKQSKKIDEQTKRKEKENEIEEEKKEPLSKEDIVRYHRLKNFGDTFHHRTRVSKKASSKGPKLANGKDFKFERNENERQKNERMKIRKSKHFSMSDIIRLRKIDFDREAAGDKVKSAMDQIGVKCLKFTNEFRAKNGLKPLKWHQALCEIGKKHSKNMGEGTVPIGHIGFYDRVKEYPFDSLRAAENVAMNKGTTIGVARTAVDGWIKSAGHRKNLLGQFTHCGIGVYQNFEGEMYLTQLFAYTHYLVDGTEVADGTYTHWLIDGK